MALDATERIASVGIVLGALEHYLGRRELQPGGSLDWTFLRLRPARSRPERLLRRRELRPVLEYPGFLWLMAVQAAAAILMAIDPRSPSWPALCLVIHVVMLLRNHTAIDGSDQLMTIVLGTSVARALVAEPEVQLAAAVFLAANVSLAYAVSGISKAQSPCWWSGECLRGILTTQTYGHAYVARKVVRHPAITTVLGPATIVWESVFPLAVVVSPEAAAAAIVGAVVFHVACAFVMGLPGFTWAFGAALPTVLVASRWLGDVLSPTGHVLVAGACAAAWLGLLAFLAGRASLRPQETKRDQAAATGSVKLARRSVSAARDSGLAK